MTGTGETGAFHGLAGVWLLLPCVVGVSTSPRGWTSRGTTYWHQISPSVFSWAPGCTPPPATAGAVGPDGGRGGETSGRPESERRGKGAANRSQLRSWAPVSFPRGVAHPRSRGWRGRSGGSALKPSRPELETAVALQSFLSRSLSHLPPLSSQTARSGFYGKVRSVEGGRRAGAWPPGSPLALLSCAASDGWSHLSVPDLDP